MRISYSIQALTDLAKKGNKDAQNHLDEVQEMNRLQMELLIWAGPVEAATDEFKQWVQSHYEIADAVGLSRLGALRGMIDEIKQAATIIPTKESE